MTNRLLNMLLVDFIRGLRERLLDRRRRKKLRRDLHALSDRELMDVGIFREQIDHVADG